MIFLPTIFCRRIDFPTLPHSPDSQGHFAFCSSHQSQFDQQLQLCMRVVWSHHCCLGVTIKSQAIQKLMINSNSIRVINMFITIIININMISTNTNVTFWPIAVWSFAEQGLPMGDLVRQRC